MREWSTALLALGLAACSVNPVPEPPAKPETDGPIVATGCLSCDGAIFVSGGTMNADRVWAVNLDRSEPPTEVNVAADGTFSLSIYALAGDELRIQPRRELERAEPADFVLPDDEGVLQAAARPLFDCMPAPLELDHGEATSTRIVTIANGCSEPVTIASIALRAPSPAFVVQSSPTPLTLAPTESESIQSQFTPSLVGLEEEILLVEISTPVVDRRAVTLFGRGTP